MPATSAIPPTFTESGLQLYPISVDQFEQMAECGIFGEDEHVELLRGVITPMSPPGPRHIAAIELLNAAFAPRIDWGRFTVRVQLTVRLAPLGSVPEPDLSITAGPPPTDPEAMPALAIEVSDSSLRYDLQVKSGIYAEAGIPDYWVLDVPGRAVHVHRDPCGTEYREITTHSSGELTALTDGIPPLDVGALLPAIGAVETAD